jgi:hypothetical protein
MTIERKGLRCRVFARCSGSPAAYRAAGPRSRFSDDERSAFRSAPHMAHSSAPSGTRSAHNGQRSGSASTFEERRNNPMSPFTWSVVDLFAEPCDAPWIKGPIQTQCFSITGVTRPRTPAQWCGYPRDHVRAPRSASRTRGCSETLRGREQRAGLVVQLVRRISRVVRHCPQAGTPGRRRQWGRLCSLRADVRVTPNGMRGTTHADCGPSRRALGRWGYPAHTRVRAERGGERTHATTAHGSSVRSTALKR